MTGHDHLHLPTYRQRLEINMTYRLRIEGPDGVTEQDYETHADAMRAIWRPMWKEDGRSLSASQNFAGEVQLDGTSTTWKSYTFTIQGPPVCGATEFDSRQYPHVCRLPADHAGEHECVCTPVITHRWSPQ